MLALLSGNLLSIFARTRYRRLAHPTTHRHRPTHLPLEARPEKHRNTAKPSQGIPMPESWLQPRFDRRNKEPALQKPDRLSTKSRRPAHRSRSPSPATVNATNGRPSTIVEGRPQRVSVLPHGCGVSDEQNTIVIGREVCKPTGSYLALSVCDHRYRYCTTA